MKLKWHNTVYTRCDIVRNILRETQAETETEIEVKWHLFRVVIERFHRALMCVSLRVMT